jgi:hypothetical protein
VQCTENITFDESDLAMKKILLLWLMAFAPAASAQTYVYHEFPDSNAVWNFAYDQFCMSFPGGGFDHIDYSVTITGDTVIGGQNYSKLYTPYLQVSVSSGCTVPVTAGYQGAFREDASAKKVFYVAPGNTTEQLLYDFNWQVGDTIFGALSAFTGSADTVISLDSILIGSGYRKIWTINDWYNVKVIEGIGSIYGLTVPSPGFVTDFPNYALTCFSQDGVTLYPTGSTVVCNLITASVEPVSPIYALFPNPASDRFTVTQGALSIKEVRLLDMTGRCLRIWDPGSDSYSVSDLPDGMYMAELWSFGGSRNCMPLVVKH